MLINRFGMSGNAIHAFGYADVQFFTWLMRLYIGKNLIFCFFWLG